MTFIIAAGLMALCAGGIGRLLWLLEGKPPLDRPAWWPRGRSNAQTAGGTPPPLSSVDCHPADSDSRPGGRLAAVGACAACCGVPVLLLAGLAISGVVATVSLMGALLLLVGLAAWRLKAARRVTSSDNTSSQAETAESCCTTADGGTRGGEMVSTNRYS